MADGVAISRLRVESELDASGYEAGAQKKVAADQRMVQSDTQVGTAVEATERKLGTRQTTLDQLIRKHDEFGRAQSSLQRQQAALARDLDAYNKAMETGSLATEQAQRIAESLRTRQQQLTQQQEQLTAAQTRGTAANTNTQTSLARLAAASETAEQRINKIRGTVNDAKGALELLGLGSNAAVESLSSLAWVVGNVADAVSVLGGILRRNPLGLAIAAVAALVAGYLYLTSATQQTAQATVSYEDALKRLNDLTGESARLERERARAIDEAGRAMAQSRLETERRNLQRLEEEARAQAFTQGGQDLARRVRPLDLTGAPTEQTEEINRRLDEQRTRVTAAEQALRAYVEALQLVGPAAAAGVTGVRSLEQAIEQLESSASPGVAAARRFAGQLRLIEEALRQPGIDPQQVARLQALRTQLAQAAGDVVFPRAAGGGTDSLAEIERQNAATADMLELVRSGRVALRDLDREREIANRLQQDGLTLDSERGRAMAAALTDQANLRDQLAQLNRDRDDANRLVQESLSPQERYVQQVQRLNDLLPVVAQLTGDMGRAQQIVNDAIQRANPAYQEYQQQLERYQRAAEQPFLEAARSIQRAFGDMFGKIFTDGVKSFSDLGDQMKRILLKAVGDIVSAEFVGPAIGQAMAFFGFQNAASRLGYLAPSAPGGVGGTSGGGSSSGLGMLQNFPLGSLFSGSGGGSFLSGASTWLNNSIGVPLGFAPAGSLAPGTYGPLAAGQVYGTTLTSALGYGLPIVGATLPGLISGNYAQAGFGFGGAALGAVVGGPVGAAIGGFLGNLVGGLFGKRPSAPPTSFAGIGVDLGLGGSLTETWRNGGSESNRRVPDYGPAGQMRLVVQDALKQIQAAVGAKITGGRYAQGSLNYYTVGDTQSYVSYVNDGLGGSAALPTAEAAVRDFLSRVVPGLTFDGDARRAQLTTIANHGADKLEDLLTRLGQAKQFQDAYDALTDTQDALSATAQQLKALADQVDTLRDSAEEFGYTVAEIDAGYQQKLAKVRGDFDQAVQDQILGLTDPQAAALKAWEKERDQAVKDAGLVGGNIVEVERLYALKREAVIKASLGNIDTALRSWLDGQVFGAASSSSPQSRFAAAQDQFAAQIALARGGDASALAGITGYADRLLGAGRGVFATTVDFANLESMVRSTLTSLGHGLGLPGFATGGTFTVGGAGGTDSQIVRFRATPGEKVTVTTPGQAGTADIVSELRAMRRSMDALVRENFMLRGQIRQQAKAS